MARALPRPWISRLVAAALSLVLSLALVFASFAGAVAHTNGHGHHHGEAPAAGISADPDHRIVDALIGVSKVISESIAAEPAESVPQHDACMDFICHGGTAVLSTGIGWIIFSWSVARALPRDSQSLVSTTPVRLDRPPKSLRSA